MVYLKNEYYDKPLIVNRIKEVDDKYAIHVNRVDGKRVNGWITITDNMIIDGLDWDDIVDGEFYELMFHRPDPKRNTKKKPEIHVEILRVLD